MYTATDGSHTAWRMVRCFGGFTCSMVWIAAIADEVVSVLQVSASVATLPSARSFENERNSWEDADD
jgi:sodium/potassium/calcium exchanger 6